MEERKNLTDRIQELEEKKANLDKEHREAQNELVYRRREMESLAKKLEKATEERDSLHNQNSRLRFDKIRLEKELKAATNALAFEEGIRKELQVATEASRIIMQTDKVALLEKEILVQFKGVPQHFDRLHTTIQDYSNEIIAVQEGLEAQLKAVLEYLREKPRTAGRSGRKEKKKVEDKEIVVVDSSNSEQEARDGILPEGVQLLGVGTRTPADQPEPSNQVVPYQQAEDQEKPEPEMTAESLALPAPEGTGVQPPTVEEIHKDALARYLEPLPPGPISTASGTPAFLAKPVGIKPPRSPSPPQQPPAGDQPASEGEKLAG